jgi:hypothetical protein
MLLWACSLRFLKRVMPLPLLVRFVGHRAIRSKQVSSDTASRIEALNRIATLSRWSCRLTRWSTGGNCHERGVVLYRYLRASGFCPSLYVGFRRDDSGHVRGHTWVEVDGRPVGESASSVAEFERAVLFDSTTRVPEPMAPPFRTSAINDES